MAAIHKLLIANRGEIARRVIRTAHALGIATVAVHSDADAHALQVREATQAVALGGDASADTYLRIDKLLAAARATGADAVHPGYGFLSENAEFAQAVIDAGLLWVGPPPAAIRALGSKSAAKRLALAQGVPCLGGYQGDDQADARFASEANKLGYPLMVKATAGGGGRGMRLVTRAEDLGAALASARSEAQASFGSAELLVERALLAPRHVEVQVFADTLGHCVHLGERDCSVQRRHQKIIEESPSPAVDAAMRERMGACAVALSRAAGYVGAGTVEFLLDGSGAFFLMEMNTRLQVEHPVTELRLGVDLVEWQLRVARGEPLPLTQAEVDERLARGGHAIEARLCAEDDHFQPHAGRIARFVAPPGVRFDHAIEEGAQVPPFYDSMLGKIVAHGADRTQALARLGAALAQTVVLGLPTNRALLRACVDHPVFRAGQALIPFLAEQGEALRDGLRAGEEAALPAAALAMLYASRQSPLALPCPFTRGLRVGHRAQTVALDVRELGRGQLALSLRGEQREAAVSHAGPGRVAVMLAGSRHDVYVAQAGARWHLQCGGSDLWLDDLSFAPPQGAGGALAASELRAPFNGKLIAVHAAPGQAVKRGDTLAVIESMKLEHALAATRDGTVAEVRAEPGQQVATSQLLMTFEAP